MLAPLQQWRCDACGEVIESPKDGYVIWRHLQRDTHYAHGFKIIHQGRCDLEDHPCSMELSHFLGPQGASYLLTFLSLGPMKPKNHPKVANLDEFADFFRRVQTPHYEEARAHFGDRDLTEQFAESSETFTCRIETLKEIAESVPAPS